MYIGLVLLTGDEYNHHSVVELLMWINFNADAKLMTTITQSATESPLLSLGGSVLQPTQGVCQIRGSTSYSLVLLFLFFKKRGKKRDIDLTSSILARSLCLSAGGLDSVLTPSACVCRWTMCGKLLWQVLKGLSFLSWGIERESSSPICRKREGGKWRVWLEFLFCGEAYVSCALPQKRWDLQP